MDIVPAQVREKMLSDLAKRLDAKLTLAALSVLPEGKIQEFEDLVSQNKSTVEIPDFFFENIPNVAQVYAQALVEFRKSYLK